MKRVIHTALYSLLFSLTTAPYVAAVEPIEPPKTIDQYQSRSFQNLRDVYSNNANLRPFIAETLEIVQNNPQGDPYEGTRKLFEIVGKIRAFWNAIPVNYADGKEEVNGEIQRTASQDYHYQQAHYRTGYSLHNIGRKSLIAQPVLKEGFSVDGTRLPILKNWVWEWNGIDMDEKFLIEGAMTTLVEFNVPNDNSSATFYIGQTKHNLEKLSRLVWDYENDIVFASNHYEKFWPLVTTPGELFHIKS